MTLKDIFGVIGRVLGLVSRIEPPPPPVEEPLPAPPRSAEEDFAAADKRIDEKLKGVPRDGGPGTG